MKAEAVGHFIMLSLAVKILLRYCGNPGIIKTTFLERKYVCTYDSLGTIAQFIGTWPLAVLYGLTLAIRAATLPFCTDIRGVRVTTSLLDLL